MPARTRPRRNPAPTELPEGFAYFPDLLDAREQDELIARIARLDFQPFDFHGYTAKRRIVEYGYEYDFGTRKASAAPPVPGFLLPLRDRVAAAAGVAAADIVEAVVTEYPAGAPIGWHRDVPQFETIFGVSLGAAARLRLKPHRREGRLVSVILAPGSLYVMRGPARWQCSTASLPPRDCATPSPFAH